MRGLGPGIPMLSPPDKILKPHDKNKIMHKKSSKVVKNQTYFSMF